MRRVSLRQASGKARQQPRAQPLGPFSAWQRLSGTVFSAGTGTFNLTTGAFTRTGAAVNQLVVYGTDMAIMTTLRAAPPLVENAIGR